MKHLLTIFITTCILFTSSSFAGQLSDQEETDLLYITEEEKLAHDVYLFFQRKYRDRVFPNIRRSEQMHMDAMAGLLEGYGLENPSQEKPGSFTKENGLQDLYNDLIKKGSNSRVDAIEVGIMIEEKDINDLVEAIAATDEAASKRVYSNLLAGSRNHLEAFTNRLQALTGDDESGQTVDPGQAQSRQKGRQSGSR